MNAPKTTAQRKADERQRQRDAGRVAVTHYVYPGDRVRLAQYVKRLNSQYIVRYDR